MKRSIILYLICITFVFITSSCADRHGCTDINACNYNPNSKKDDGSCEYEPSVFADRDGDGLGNPNESISSCSPTVSMVTDFQYVSNSLDTDDLFETELNKDERVTALATTATWCGPCGFRHDNLSELILQHPDQVITMVCHYDDAISTIDDFSSFFTEEIWDYVDSGLPGFYIGSQRTGLYKAWNYSAESEWRPNFAKVSLATEAKLVDGKIDVKAKLRFNENLDVAHYIGLYLLESGIYKNQYFNYGNGGSAYTELLLHNRVLRASLWQDNEIGIKKIADTCYKNQFFGYHESFDIPENVLDGENLHVVAIVYSGNTIVDISNSAWTRVE